jgi:ABC-type nitrate/sulfonate/bicarbonate transport system substrate-binding protein
MATGTRRNPSGAIRRLAQRIGAVAVAASMLLPMTASAVLAQAQQPFKLRIGGQHPPIFEYIHWHDSFRNGFLRKYGVEAQFTGFTAGLTATQALAGGSLDIACDGLGSTVAAIANGSPARLVLLANADNPYVIVTSDKIAKPADLKGKKWAITQMGAISQTYGALWLTVNGVKADKGDPVDWIPIGGPAARTRAIIAGQVDAALVTMGDWFRIKNEKGVKLLAELAASVPPLPLGGCAASNKLIAERPDVVQGFVNGTIDAIRDARTPEGKARTLKLAKELNQANAKLSDAELEELYEYYLGSKANPFLIDPNGGMYPDVMGINIRMMVEEKTLKSALPLESVWDARFANAYLGERGWYDPRTGKSQAFLRDIIMKR